MHVSTYSAAIRVCAVYRQQNAIFVILAEMQKKGIEPDACIYHNAVAVCKSCSQAGLALEILSARHVGEAGPFGRGVLRYGRRRLHKLQPGRARAGDPLGDVQCAGTWAFRFTCPRTTPRSACALFTASRMRYS